MNTDTSSDQERLRKAEALLSRLDIPLVSGQRFEDRLLGWPAPAIERHLVALLPGLPHDLTILGALMAPPLARYVHRTQSVFTASQALSTLKEDSTVAGLLPIAASVTGLDLEDAVQKVVHHWANKEVSPIEATRSNLPNPTRNRASPSLNRKIALTSLGLIIGFVGTTAIWWTVPRTGPTPSAEAAVEQPQGPSSIPHPDQIPDFAATDRIQESQRQTE